MIETFARLFKVPYLGDYPNIRLVLSERDVFRVDAYFQK